MGRFIFIFSRPTYLIKGYLLHPSLLQLIIAIALFMLSIWSKHLKDIYKTTKNAHIKQRFDIRNAIYFPQSKRLFALLFHSLVNIFFHLNLHQFAYI